MEDEVGEPLSIGSVVGGRTQANAGWRPAIRELGERVAEARVGVETPLNVNIVFHVPGHILQLDYSGVRTGSYSNLYRDGGVHFLTVLRAHFGPALTVERRGAAARCDRRPS